MKRLTYN